MEIVFESNIAASNFMNIFNLRCTCLFEQRTKAARFSKINIILRLVTLAVPKFHYIRSSMDTLGHNITQPICFRVKTFEFRVIFLCFL